MGQCGPCEIAVFVGRSVHFCVSRRRTGADVRFGYQAVSWTCGDGICRWSPFFVVFVVPSAKGGKISDAPWCREKMIVVFYFGRLDCASRFHHRLQSQEKNDTKKQNLTKDV